MDRPEELREKTFVNVMELDMISVFDRGDVKDLIHMITLKLKSEGAKIPFIFLPFRVQLNDKRLTFFLQKTLQNLNNPSLVKSIIKKTDCYTLMAGLKFIWCRLPDLCVIGWDLYTKFRALEKRQNNPKNAFLDIMPTCLPSADHALIVYDFLDLLTRIAAYTKENKLSGRKVAKLAGLWAFSGPAPPLMRDLVSLLDLSIAPENGRSFIDGLEEWIPALEATFHLLLAFLRSMLPSDSSAKVKILRLLQLLLASNTYPPEPNASPLPLTAMPLITIYSKSPARDPIELMDRALKVLSFDKPEMFDAKEDYTVLKYLIKENKKPMFESLTPESGKIVEKLCLDKKYYLLHNGWCDEGPVETPETDVHKASVLRIAIDDYYIWAWMLSVSLELLDIIRSLFGKSLVAEFEYKEDQVKWVIIQECGMDDPPPVPKKDGYYESHRRGLESEIDYSYKINHKPKKKVYREEDYDDEEDDDQDELEEEEEAHQFMHHKHRHGKEHRRTSRSPEKSPKTKSRHSQPSGVSPGNYHYEQGYEAQYFDQGYYQYQPGVQQMPQPVPQGAPQPGQARHSPTKVNIRPNYRPVPQMAPGVPQMAPGVPQMAPGAPQMAPGAPQMMPQMMPGQIPGQVPVQMPVQMPGQMPAPMMPTVALPGLMPGMMAPGMPPAPGYRPPPPGYRPNVSPQPPQGRFSGNVSPAKPPQPVTRSDIAIASMPAASGFNKLHGPGANKTDKKALRSAFVSGDFGI